MKNTTCLLSWKVIPGNIIYELKNNDRVIGGIDEKSTLSAGQFYKSFVDGSIHLTDAKTAEMCKLVENASRDNQIALQMKFLSFLQKQV